MALACPADLSGAARSPNFQTLPQTPARRPLCPPDPARPCVSTSLQAPGPEAITNQHRDAWGPAPTADRLRPRWVRPDCGPVGPTHSPPPPAHPTWAAPRWRLLAPGGEQGPACHRWPLGCPPAAWALGLLGPAGHTHHVCVPERSTVHPWSPQPPARPAVTATPQGTGGGGAAPGAPTGRGFPSECQGLRGTTQTAPHGAASSPPTLGSLPPTLGSPRLHWCHLTWTCVLLAEPISFSD
uniref:Uncharacterized protein n=1 Tax=Myotis myotis TaxID=51298 RepID=A0A7J7V3L5_MYOMY|nr:hypothetical protein mMyoMyo1_008413 [Myotis myotis]